MGRDEVRLHRRRRAAPPTVNPSLWRQSQLCAKGGVFKVVDRLYQVRNQDRSNLTIVEGDTGLILTRAALDRFIVGATSREAETAWGELRVEPDLAPLQGLLSLLDTFEGWFNIIEP